jgi:putative FmdB family regulatory protein
MPTYEYECTACHYRFEKFQSIKDDPLSTCPECQGSVKRLIGGGIGIIFKGSGFYTTDYKKSSSISGPSNNNKNKPDNGSSGDKTKETNSKSETKKETAKDSGKAAAKSSP